jgi:hypothetical protein
MAKAQTGKPGITALSGNAECSEKKAKEQEYV